MLKNPASQSGLFNPRVFFGFLLCATGASLGVFSLAPTPLALAQVSPEGACVPVPGLNDRCPAWAHQYPPPGTLQDGCTEEPAHLIAGTEAVYLASTRSCGGQFDILVLAYGFDGELLWVQTHNGAANLRDYVFNLAVSPDGHHLYVVGSENRGTSVDWVTISLNTTTGEKEWVSYHDGPIGKDDEAWLAAVSDDGKRLYVSGWDTHTDSEGQERNDTVTIAYDALTGEEQWQVRFDGDPQLLDYPRAIGVVGDRVVITGSSLEPFVGGQDIQTVVYRDNREGDVAEELWRARYDGGEWDQPLIPCLSREVQLCFGLMGSVGVTEDLVAVGATSYIPGTNNAVWSTLVYDLDTGEPRWVKHFGDPTQVNTANDIAVAPDGGTIYMTGYTNTQESEGVGDAAVVAYDSATGEERWHSTYGLSDVEDASGFSIVATTNHVYVSGQVQLWIQPFHSEVLTIALDASSGASEWVGRHSRVVPAIGNADRGHWIVLSPDGNRLVIGGGFGNVLRAEDPSDYHDLGLVAYDIAPKVVSRKVHGSAGAFDVDLPLTGTPAIECRSGGANGDYTLVFTFANTLIAVGGANVTSGTGSVSSSNIDSNDAHNYIVNLTGVTNAQIITVSLTNVIDSAGIVSSVVDRSMSVLIGDTTGNSAVNSSDIAQTQSQSGQPVTSTNFREDVTVNGLINSSDIGLVQSKSGTGLP